MRDLYLDDNNCRGLGHQARKIIVGYPYRSGDNTMRLFDGEIEHEAFYSGPSTYKTILLRKEEVR